MCVWLQLDLDSSAGLNKVQFKAWLPNIALGGPFCNCTSGFNCKVECMFPRAGTCRTCQSITRFNDFQDFLWLMACKALLKNLTNEEEHSIQQPYMLCIAVHLWPKGWEWWDTLQTRCRHVAGRNGRSCSRTMILTTSWMRCLILKGPASYIKSYSIQHVWKRVTSVFNQWAWRRIWGKEMEKTHFGVSN